MARKTAAWVLTTKAPESLLAEFQRTAQIGEEELYRLMAIAHEKGWIKLLGVAKGSPAQVAAEIQSQTSASVIKLDEDSEE